MEVKCLEGVHVVLKRGVVAHDDRTNGNYGDRRAAHIRQHLHQCHLVIDQGAVLLVLSDRDHEVADGLIRFDASRADQ